MADDNITGVSQEARRKRINRLKKMIVTTIVVGISLPLVLCVFMLIRMNRLEKLVEEMKMVVETELSVKELPKVSTPILKPLKIKNLREKK